MYHRFQTKRMQWHFCRTYNLLSVQSLFSLIAMSLSRSTIHGGEIQEERQDSICLMLRKCCVIWHCHEMWSQTTWGNKSQNTHPKHWQQCVQHHLQQCCVHWSHCFWDKTIFQGHGRFFKQNSIHPCGHMHRNREWMIQGGSSGSTSRKHLEQQVQWNATLLQYLVQGGTEDRMSSTTAVRVQITGWCVMSMC